MREPIRVVPAPELPGVTIIDAHWSAAPPPHCMFEGHVVRVQHRGVVDLRYRRRRHRAGPGVYTVSPGEMLVHEAAVSLPLASHAVVVEPRRFAELLARVGVVDPVFTAFRVTGRPHELAAAVAGLVVAVEAGLPRPAQESALHALVERVAACCGAAPPEPDRHPVFAALHRHLVRNQARNVTLDELAALAGLSTFQVLRLFRSEVGIPPHAYLVQLRVARARRLISSGMAPAEVAATVGFADQSHLGRHFRAIAARTPAAYLGPRGAAGGRTSALAVRDPVRGRELVVDPGPAERGGGPGQRGPGDDRSAPA